MKRNGKAHEYGTGISKVCVDLENRIVRIRVIQTKQARAKVPLDGILENIYLANVPPDAANRTCLEDMIELLLVAQLSPTRRTPLLFPARIRICTRTVPAMNQAHSGRINDLLLRVCSHIRRVPLEYRAVFSDGVTRVETDEVREVTVIVLRPVFCDLPFCFWS